MRENDLRKLLARVERGSPLIYPYARDDYALTLLRWAVGAGTTVSALKRSPHAGLLDKPRVKSRLAAIGHGWITPDDLSTPNTADSHPFRVTFGRWIGDAGWKQTSRQGSQLVLQLNFPAAHDRAFRRKVRPKGDHPFRWGCHPVNRSGQETLAWARIDYDPFLAEGLVEEVQSDWVRQAREIATEARTYKGRRQLRRDLALDGVRGSLESVLDYLRHDLAPYAQLWQEATLACALHLLIERFGARRVYYHSWEGGLALKQMGDWAPPRSLYQRLPRRFCLTSSSRGPAFVEGNPDCRRRMRTRDAVGWYRLDASHQEVRREHAA